MYSHVVASIQVDIIDLVNTDLDILFVVQMLGIHIKKSTIVLFTLDKNHIF
jgi:hypothetical protein